MQQWLLVCPKQPPSNFMALVQVVNTLLQSLGLHHLSAYELQTVSQLQLIVCHLFPPDTQTSNHTLY